MQIKVLGSGFGDERSGMLDANDGYYSFVTFADVSATMIATKYPVWMDSTVKTKFKKLFIDLDGDYLQDGTEPFLAVGDIPPGAYGLAVNTIYFHDDGNGVYDEADTVYDSALSNLETFALTDEPVIYYLDPSTTPPTRPGDGKKVLVMGLSFGDSQATSILHIGDKSWAEGHPKIKVWKDHKIKFKVPVYEAPFPKWKEVWVTVDGQDSNSMWLKVTAP